MGLKARCMNTEDEGSLSFRQGRIDLATVIVAEGEAGESRSTILPVAGTSEDSRIVFCRKRDGEEA